jgi:hypothetical protein
MLGFRACDALRLRSGQACRNRNGNPLGLGRFPFDTLRANGPNRSIERPWLDNGRVWPGCFLAKPASAVKPEAVAGNFLMGTAAGKPDRAAAMASLIVEWLVSALGVACVVYEAPPEQPVAGTIQKLTGNPKVDSVGSPSSIPAWMPAWPSAASRINWIA